MKKHKYRRIVLTGGPGGGKTTAADLFRREIGDRVVVVPEAATILYKGGFPRNGNNEVNRSTQRAIYHVQMNLEEAQSAAFHGRILLCDRGTVDGAAYWPEDADDFFSCMGTTKQEQFSRYDAVLFFETAAVGGASIEGGNPARNESIEQAIAIDKRLRDLWSAHSNFIFIPHNNSCKNAVLFTGYQALGSKGAVLKNGISKLRIHHINIDVEAEIVSLDSLSAHADSDEIIKWISNIKEGPQKIFLVHGELLSRSALAYRIKNELGKSVDCPKMNEEFLLDDES